jgi:hypothetical protein
MRYSEATPYTEESRIQGFLNPLHKGPVRPCIENHQTAGNEKIPRVPVIVVTDYVHPLNWTTLPGNYKFPPTPLATKWGGKVHFLVTASALTLSSNFVDRIAD